MNAYIRTIAVRRSATGTFAVWVNGQLVEGGFFSRGPAEAAREWWQRNYRGALCPRCGADDATGCYCGQAVRS